MSTYLFSKKEEIAHAITHGIGAFLSIAALVLLIVFSSMNGNALLIVSVTIFGSTMLFMYTSSTIVHSLPIGKWKNIFLIIDHASIYLFIAGTYTPFLLIQLKGTFGWVLFGVIWGLALVGIILKLFFVKKFIILSTLFYIAMGWLIVIAWKPLTDVLHQQGIIFLVTGGIMYTVGAIFYVWNKVPYHHVIWHLFVIAGSTFHFFTVFFYVI
ncbi:hemolysin III family protein [Pseudogracilibacillus auburnensis]|uniref:Channel protein (Hemolysin III family) n=1 Tax=Pseudogracilibacillus auburnensis TaxID=1494959 RepID=A0A2V3W4J6_9BACI|nr:hemolysin III family protein [Pseudogracilibacillus auburnensis]MBO1003575.1 hemolysin III family protein [Pseudogracilibacillus auburnensis]PXW89263.1 channel protein (hemolysin III family) [Pseudogracilibacillus auburnensis]